MAGYRAMNTAGTINAGLCHTVSQIGESSPKEVEPDVLRTDTGELAQAHCAHPSKAPDRGSLLLVLFDKPNESGKREEPGSPGISGFLPRRQRAQSVGHGSVKGLRKHDGLSGGSGRGAAPGVRRHHQERLWASRKVATSIVQSMGPRALSRLILGIFFQSGCFLAR